MGLLHSVGNRFYDIDARGLPFKLAVMIPLALMVLYHEKFSILTELILPGPHCINHFQTLSVYLIERESIKAEGSEYFLLPQ